MAYRITFADRLQQFGWVSYQLIATDDDDVMSPQRVPIDLRIEADTPEIRDGLEVKWFVIFTDQWTDAQVAP